MASRKLDDIGGATLPFGALQLLAPPVRLVSAAIWKVLKQRDVMQYGVVEEFVTTVCQTIPGLLTFRHQAKLILGLRARLVLELCRSQPDAEVIAPHLEKIRAADSSSVKKDVKITKTVQNFLGFVHELLTNAAERERFFTEVFPVEYGPKFEQDLEKLLWEFLIRLDQLLPVPTLSQTVSWLSEAPAVLEECAQSATQPQLLNILLQHQTCLGHLECAASLPPNMGNSILASLSLPPSGQVASNHLTGDGKLLSERWYGSQPGDTSPFVTPVIGLISTETVPVMISARKRARQAEEATDEQLDSSKNHAFTSVKWREKAKEDGGKDVQEQVEDEVRVLNPSNGIKHKQGDMSDGETEEDEAESPRDVLREHSVGKLHLPEEPILRSVFASCLSKHPRVVLEKLSFVSSGCSSLSEGGGGGGGGGGITSFYTKQNSHRRKLTEQKQTNHSQSSECPSLDNKQNQLIVSRVNPQSNAEAMALRGDGEYVADSEDEGTKNFKGRLFVKRYYKTKHGSYVPTLREFWKPGVTRRDVLLAVSKRR